MLRNAHAVIVTILAVNFFGNGVVAHAQEAAETKSTIENVKSETPAVEPGSDADVDSIITNKKMRAESGSKSKYSIASQFYYNGGSIDKPLASDRPNIAGAAGTTDYSLLDGAISAKYNLSTSNSLMAGVGVRWITPLQGTQIPQGYNGTKFDVDNPYLIFQHIYKWSGVQSVLQFQPTVYTDANLRAEGFVSSLAVAQNNIYEIGHTGLSLGLYLLAQGAYFDSNTFVNREKQSDYLVNIDPFLEYTINDRFNFRTVTNLWNYEHYRSVSNAGTYTWDKVYQSVGLGISVTRDIFLYPNVQFLPDNIRADRTNVAINSAINLF